MPRVNTTIDVFSPLIVYSPLISWLTGNDTEDSQGGRYQDGTFIVSSKNGSASFAFKGTAVWLFGAKRSNHGNYSVTLDDVSPSQVFDGNNANGEFRTLLYGASGLSFGDHKVVITNLLTNVTEPFVDLDFIILESVVGDDDSGGSDSPLATTIATVSRSSTLFEFGGTGWINSPYNQSFQATDGMYTSTPGDTLFFTFEGEAVTVVGAVGPLCGQYNVSLDNSTSTSYNGSRVEPNAGQILFYASGLEHGIHNLLFTNLPPSSKPGVISGDSLLIQQIANQSTSVESTMPSFNTSGASEPTVEKKRELPKGLGIGILSGVAGRWSPEVRGSW
ncbi:hypothetical protein SCHPADRAFT_903125 [Schizopora paradoxa]|uniref:Uncharacterized protein n=1 Tax=Schizopora paradoxa TaxID=27342 RepID=A0A0H2RSK7_9AGAM|nr:hypothetical protein SCHPADRAFT_903125 [Schizopora paradoxa]